MRFEITARKVEVKCEDVFGDTREDAAKLFRDKYPDFRIDDVCVVTDFDEEEGKAIGEGWMSAGRCEACSVELWEGEEYVTDVEDGLQFCPKCANESVAT